MRTTIWSGSLLNHGQIIMLINKPWIFLIKNALQMSHCRGFITQSLNSINYTVCTMSLIVKVMRVSGNLLCFFPKVFHSPLSSRGPLASCTMTMKSEFAEAFFHFYLYNTCTLLYTHTNSLTSFTIKAIKG